MDVMKLAVKAGMRPMLEPHDVNALGKCVPLKWLEKLVELAIEEHNAKIREALENVMK